MPTYSIYKAQNFREKKTSLPNATAFKFRNVSSAIKSLDQKLSTSKSSIELKTNNQVIIIKNLQQLAIAIRRTRGDTKVSLKIPKNIRDEISNYIYGDSFIADVELGFGNHFETKYQGIETRIAQSMAAVMADRLSALTQQLKEHTDRLASNASTGFLDLVFLGVITISILYATNEAAGDTDDQWEAYQGMSDQGKKHTQNFKDGMNALMSDWKKDEEKDEDDKDDTSSGSIVEPGWPYVDGEQGNTLHLEIMNLLYKFSSDIRAFELLLTNKYVHQV
jgi:hypothetical protein